jgi:hypothetical protein
MRDEFAALADRAEHYRQLASIIRARAASMKTPEAGKALAAVAGDYELLAYYAESLVSTELTLRAAVGRVTAAE